MELRRVALELIGSFDSGVRHGGQYVEGGDGRQGPALIALEIAVQADHLVRIRVWKHGRSGQEDRRQRPWLWRGCLSFVRSSAARLPKPSASHFRGFLRVATGPVYFRSQERC